MGFTLKSHVFLASTAGDVKASTVIPENSRLVGLAVVSSNLASGSAQLAVKLDIGGTKTPLVWAAADLTNRVAFEWFGNSDTEHTFNDPTSPTLTPPEVRGNIPALFPIKFKDDALGAAEIYLNAQLVSAGSIAILFYTTDVPGPYEGGVF